jgi:hypothetical protein
VAYRVLRPADVQVDRQPVVQQPLLADRVIIIRDGKISQEELAS